MEGHLHFVQWLIKNGVDIDKTDKFGHTATKIAELREHFDVWNYLRACQDADSELLQEFKQMSVLPNTGKFKEALRDVAHLNRTINVWKEAVEDTKENEKIINAINTKAEIREASKKITRARNRRIMNNI